MKTLAFPVLTPEEFFGVALRAVLEQYETDTREGFIEMALRLGIPKFDPDNLAVFVKALPGFILFDSVFVTTHCKEIFWFVSGDRAMTCSVPPGFEFPSEGISLRDLPAWKAGQAEKKA